MHSTLFPNVDSYIVNLSHPILELSRNKYVTNHFGQELKTATNTPAAKRSFTDTVVEHTKKC